MPAYCTATLQGDTCADSRCQYRHDIVRCEPCGRSFPASLINQHESGKNHLQNVAASTLHNNLETPLRSSPSQSSSHNLQFAPPQAISPQSWTGTSTRSADPRVTVSAEGGIDFVVEGTGTAANPFFPCASQNISIEKTDVLSSLSVQEITLVCSSSSCFSASLTGIKAVIRKRAPRTIVVSFKPPRAGIFHAELKIMFEDPTRPHDREFTVTRELRGRAILPASAGSTSNGDAPNAAEQIAEGEDSGITVSPEICLEFSDVFSARTKGLTITKSSNTPLITFTGARVCSSGESVADSFSAHLEGDSRVIKPGQQHIVTVSFTPRREGLCVAVLELTFRNHKRKADFVVKRTLSGWSNRPTATDGQEYRQNGPARNLGSWPLNDWADRVSVDDEEREEEKEKEVFLDSDGTGISVSHEDGLDFGIVERKRRNGPFATPSSLLTIELAVGFPSVTFVKEKTRTVDGSDPEFVAVFEGDSLNIPPGTESTVRVIFSPKFEGMFKATLELVFWHNQLMTWFVVRRKLQGIAGSLEDHEHFESLGHDDDDGKPIRQVPPRKVVLLSSPDRRGKSRAFPVYEVSPVIQEAVDGSTVTRPYDKSAPGLLSTLMPNSLNMRTYAHYFETLLSVEDGHQQWDVLCHSPYEVNVQGRGQRYSVEIENEDEDLLPEVVPGDFLWLDDIHDNIRYEACTTAIDVFARQHLAVLKMSLTLPPNFTLYQEAQFILRFRHNRITLRRQYHALSASFVPLRRLLFPSVSDIKPMRSLSRTEHYNLKRQHLVNRGLHDDDQQLQAVVSILEQPKGSVPFIIYGPPGTGKTSTIVESIVQLVRHDAGARVLACTPSQVAVDLLLERLAAAGLDSGRMYRLNPSLHHEDPSEGEQTFTPIPGHERLLSFRVILSTCSSASVLQALNVPVGHFSHIVIDEAAQAEEPLAMIPIMTFSDEYTNVILAGDPDELRPVIKSPTAAKAGLGKSYLQRLVLMQEVYGLDTQIGKTIVVLRRNRRSQGAIIAWSNRYLYEDMMRDYGNAYITYHLVLSEVLPKKGFPVVFHGVRGSEQRTKWSPYFNILEASIIRNYCVKLTGDPERKIYPEEIGVLAPYKAQVRAIRELLKVAKLSDISVGPVEQFQGQERKVIILVTTRSDEESHPRKELGYLGNRQRMNVAITRAQTLLIVIGDPEVLGKDENWRTFLDYIKSRKGWTGKMQNWKPVDVPLPGYEIIPRKGGVAYGEEFIGGKSENTYRRAMER